MMPNLGQGGCQAIEDAYELTRALKGVTLGGAAGEPDAHRAALQAPAAPPLALRDPPALSTPALATLRCPRQALALGQALALATFPCD